MKDMMFVLMEVKTMETEAYLKNIKNIKGHIYLEITSQQSLMTFLILKEFCYNKCIARNYIFSPIPIPIDYNKNRCSASFWIEDV